MSSPDPVNELIEAGRDREAAEAGARATAAASAPPTHQPDEPLDPVTQFHQVGAPLGAVIAALDESDLARPTPCADFSVRGVLEHMISGATVFAAAYRGEEPPSPDLDDPLTAVKAALAGLGEAISRPGALDRTVAAPFGEVSGEHFARFIVLDGLVHGWDLAVASGQPYEPPAHLVAAAHEFASVVLDPLRDGTTFAAAVEPPADATPIERLAAYTGRRVVGAANPPG